MIEVEVKYRVADRDRLSRLLTTLAGDGDDRGHCDTHFGGRSLRLRAYTGGGAEIVCKGRRLKSPAKVRPEVVVEVGDAGEALKLLLALGFDPELRYRKERRQWGLTRGPLSVRVAVDSIEGVGVFAEVEVVLPAGSADTAAAEAAVAAVAAELGLTEVEPRSYRKLVRGAAK